MFERTAIQGQINKADIKSIKLRWGLKEHLSDRDELHRETKDHHSAKEVPQPKP